VEWGVHNLLDAAPYPHGCDVVLCRNVLIYFDAADRARAVERLFAAARPGGFVGVGSTELLAARALAPGWYAPAAEVR
jgi:chemotaxis protein methyltransferase CheR